MLMFAYCIRDRVACECAPIFESKNDATAIRAAQELFAAPNAPDSADFELLVVGSVEHDDPFKFTPIEPPRAINIPRNVRQVTRLPDGQFQAEDFEGPNEEDK